MTANHKRLWVLLPLPTGPAWTTVLLTIMSYSG